MKHSQSVCLNEILDQIENGSCLVKKLGHILENPCVCSKGNIFSSIIMKMVRIFVRMKSQTFLKMNHVRSKTRFSGQILEKPCVGSRGHIFSPIIMKLCQNVCLDEISDKLENGSCQIKNQVKC